VDIRFLLNRRIRLGEGEVGRQHPHCETGLSEVADARLPDQLGTAEVMGRVHVPHREDPDPVG
jgi:hypothetical protein